MITSYEALEKALKKKKEQRRKPKEGEDFYAVWVSADELNVEPWCFWDDGVTKQMLKVGNCFRTKKEAQQKLKLIKQILKG